MAEVGALEFALGILGGAASDPKHPIGAVVAELRPEYRRELRDAALQLLDACTTADRRDARAQRDAAGPDPWDGGYRA